MKQIKTTMIIRKKILLLSLFYKSQTNSDMNNIQLINKLDFLMNDFTTNKSEIALLVRDLKIDTNLANAILYSGPIGHREHRFELFLILLEECDNLKSDYTLAYNIFREAYIMTDNIYYQIQKSNSTFDIANYIIMLHSKINIMSAMQSHELSFFNSLNNNITIYRGLSDAEKNSHKLGISWTIDSKRAEKYVFYKKNNVTDSYGWIASATITKDEILTIFGVEGQDYEIIAQPCFQNVQFKHISRK